MNRFSIHEDAESELSAAANYYESQSPGLGGAYIEEFERAVHQILTYPFSCQLVNRTVRRKVLRRFPYNIMYSRNADTIRILAIAPPEPSSILLEGPKMKSTRILRGGKSCQAGSKRY